jgi:hypothetical protein
MHAYYWAARADLPPPLLLRFRTSAASNTRLSHTALREFARRKAPAARQPAKPPAQLPAPTPASAPAARAQQAPAAQPSQARPATPTARSEPPVPAQRPAQRPATAPAAKPGPTEALHEKLLAEAAARVMTSLTALAA